MHARVNIVVALDKIISMLIETATLKKFSETHLLSHLVDKNCKLSYPQVDLDIDHS